jgi:solute carrier family 25 iron transporter 28/37
MIMNNLSDVLSAKREIETNISPNVNAPNRSHNATIQSSLPNSNHVSNMPYHHQNTHVVQFPKKGEPTSWMAHMDEADLLDMEGVSLSTAMIAGSFAGVSEHVCMFPVDTIKTRMQASAAHGQPTYPSVFSALVTVAKTEGIARLYRGLGAIVVGAIPSHAFYFGVYETARTKLDVKRGQHKPIETGVAGALATMAHDFVVTPLDVIKQRLQMFDSPYTGVFDCMRKTLSKEGIYAFYASYPTTVLLNIPYMTVNFVTYETLQTLLLTTPDEHSTWKDIVSGAGGGALGGIVSTPLDVVKTRLQLQSEGLLPDIVSHSSANANTSSTSAGHRKLMGLSEMVRHIHNESGISGFTRGWQARMMLFTPSAAICWTAYEFMKRTLLKQD